MTARDPGFVERLAGSIRGRVAPAEPLARYSTFRIGGPATVAHPATPEDVATLIRLANQAEVPWFALGLGSNVLLPDEGLEALVIRLGKGLDRIDQRGQGWIIEAGLPAPRAARITGAAGCSGLHQMVGVPGTVGGGVYMNAGCHGTDWASVTRRVTVVNPDGTDRILERSEIPFGYRSSGLGDVVVVEAEVELPAADPEDIAGEIRDLLAWREAGTPFKSPCCGSTFTNPVLPAGYDGQLRTAGQFLDAAGLKGTREGAIEISHQHANYFVNTGGGCSVDVVKLMVRARDRVKDRFGVDLVPEVRLISVSGRLMELNQAMSS